MTELPRRRAILGRIDMHRRIRDVIAQVDELRAKTIEGRVAIDNKVLLQQLHSEAAWNPRLARQPESSLTSTNDLRDPHCSV